METNMEGEAKLEKIFIQFFAYKSQKNFFEF